MNNITLKSIKCESVKSIFNTIADADKISRAAISEKTDLSLVTVGKVVDALLDMKVILQAKEVKAKAGRRAGMLKVNSDRYAAILDITSYDFHIAILNLRLQMVDKFIYKRKPDLSFDDSFYHLFYDAAGYVEHAYKLKNCFGVGVSCPGPYNAETDSVSTFRIPELCQMNIRESLELYFKDIPIMIDSHINAAARSNIMYIDNYKEKNIVYWYIGERYVCGAFAVKGDVILGRDHMACEFGKMPSLRGLSLEDRINLARCPEDYASALAIPMYTIIKILNPHAFIIECDMPSSYEDIMPLLKEELIRALQYDATALPEFHKACCKYRNSHRGLTMGLRDMWIDKLVFGADS